MQLKNCLNQSFKIIIPFFIFIFLVSNLLFARQLFSNNNLIKPSIEINLGVLHKLKNYKPANIDSNNVNEVDRNINKSNKMKIKIKSPQKVSDATVKSADKVKSVDVGKNIDQLSHTKSEDKLVAAPNKTNVTGDIKKSENDQKLSNNEDLVGRRMYLIKKFSDYSEKLLTNNLSHGKNDISPDINSKPKLDNNKFIIKKYDIYDNKKSIQETFQSSLNKLKNDISENTVENKEIKIENNIAGKSDLQNMLSKLQDNLLTNENSKLNKNDNNKDKIIINLDQEKEMVNLVNDSLKIHNRDITEKRNNKQFSKDIIKDQVKNSEIKPQTNDSKSFESKNNNKISVPIVEVEEVNIDSINLDHYNRDRNDFLTNDDFPMPDPFILNVGYITNVQNENIVIDNLDKKKIEHALSFLKLYDNYKIKIISEVSDNDIELGKKTALQKAMEVRKYIIDHHPESEEKIIINVNGGKDLVSKLQLVLIK